jgi:3-methyladenine DNA glycosylase Mpg
MIRETAASLCQNVDATASHSARNASRRSTSPHGEATSQYVQHSYPTHTKLTLLATHSRKDLMRWWSEAISVASRRRKRRPM